MPTPLPCLCSLLIFLMQVHAALCYTTTACGPGPHNVSSQITLEVYQKEGERIIFQRTNGARFGYWSVTYLKKKKQKQEFRKRVNVDVKIDLLTVKRLLPVFQGIAVGYDELDNGSRYMRRAVLNVWERPMLQWSTANRSTNFTLYEGQNLTGLCFKIIAGKPQPTVEVVRLPSNKSATNYILTSHKHQPDQTHSCLQYFHLSKADSGNYGLRARNCLPESSPDLLFSLRVLPGASPSLDIQSFQSGRSTVAGHAKGISVVKGQNVRIMYSVSGNPLPTVTWKHNGQTLNTGHRIKYNYTQLHITQVTVAESGDYTIVLANVMGKSSSTIHLHIQDPYLLPTQQSNKSLLLTSTTKLITSTALKVTDGTSALKVTGTSGISALNVTDGTTALKVTGTPALNVTDGTITKAAAEHWQVTMIVGLTVLGVATVLLIVVAVIIRIAVKRLSNRRQTEQKEYEEAKNKCVLVDSKPLGQTRPGDQHYSNSTSSPNSTPTNKPSPRKLDVIYENTKSETHNPVYQNVKSIYRTSTKP